MTMLQFLRQIFRRPPRTPYKRRPDNSDVPQEYVALYVIRNYDRIMAQNLRLQRELHTLKHSDAGVLRAKVERQRQRLDALQTKTARLKAEIRRLKLER